MILPDGRITGLCDAMSVIRAKFIQTIPGNARDALSTLNPREFEQVVAELYAGMRYEITLTKATRDGGRDVIAEKNTAGSKERALIDCKLYNKSQVGREQVSKLLGTVSNERATKGVIVTTGHVTKGAQEFNPRIEVIKFEQLCRLFNEFFGSSWAYRLDEIILANIRRNEKPLKDSNSAN